jgi:protein involved in polysaccharide export with SLBB domain
MLRSLKNSKKISIGLALVLVISPFAFTRPASAQTVKKASTHSPFRLVPNAHEVESVPLDNGYPPILIGPGDLLIINVYGETALATEYQVDADGDITFPYLGAIKLANLTPNEASEKLANALFKPRKVSILIKESNTYWISVIGEVGHAGKLQIKGKPTLLATLSEAGGPLNDSDLSNALIIHQDVRTKIDLTKYLKGVGPTDPEPYLYPGDVLMVPKEGWPTINDIFSLIALASGLVVIGIQISGSH